MIHVLFDVDETIVTTKSGLNAQASAQMFKKVFNVDTNEETVDNFAKTESWIIKAVLAKDGVIIDTVPENAYKVWAEETSKLLRHDPPTVLPGIPELLYELSRRNNVTLALLTGNSLQRADAKIHPTNLCNYFVGPNGHTVNGVFGNMADIRGDLLIQFKKQVPPDDQIIIVDDSLIGAQMASEQHIPSILVATGRTPKNILKRYSPHVFDDFGENRWKQAVNIIESYQVVK